ncbi:MAG: TRAP transporter large permease subunit [Calditrichaeota bacterium]|nr:TRAP transporter large permease subunit [Calditrichota bacterium]RQW06228.1 MAG: TRAP transporter large permease subunit [Calditrichota bacterium]
MITILIGLLLIVLALFGTPLFTIISAVALLAFYAADISSAAVIVELYRLASMPILPAIPLFTFAGYLLAESDTPKRLVNFSRAFFGWIPGGLSVVVLVSCAIFTAFTGASGVTIIALGGLLYPVLLKENYPQKFSLGMLTASGNLGLLFPPSLPIILYGLISGVSVDQLFLAGVIPGILMVVLLSVYAIYYVRDIRVPVVPFSWKNAWLSVKETAWEIPLPFIILIGIYGGYITITEAASVTAFYVLIVEVFIYRDIKIRTDLPRVMKESMVLVGGILVILGAALGLANYMVDAEIPMKILAFMKQFITSKVVFLITLNIFLLIVGFLMDIFSAIMVVVPLIIPIADNFGVDPVHLGIIFLANLGIGYSTPPVGMNLFIASFRFNQPIVKLYVAAIPFLVILLIALAIITYVPDLSLFLVRIFSAPG